MTLVKYLAMGFFLSLLAGVVTDKQIQSILIASIIVNFVIALINRFVV